MTLLLVVAQLVVLSVLGVAALAPVRPGLREKLLPAAPILGAALIAVITNWTCRWLSVRQAVPVILVVAAALLVYGVRKGRQPFRSSRGAMVSVALVVAVCAGGLAVAGAPVAVTASAGDTGAVAPAYVIDGFYFAGVSTYLVDHPIVPGPTVTGSWVGNDPPTTAPADDTVLKRLRFGQSAVAATLSVLVVSTPYETVYSVSLLWLLLLGVAAFVSGSILGLRRRWALLAAVVVTSSAHVLAQPLQGQNDGLLGASLFLLALVLSASLLQEPRYTWPLVLVGAGIAATYSEYLILLVPTVAVLGLVGRRSEVLHRLNLLGGRWAATVVLVPWAWVWLAQSFKTTSRTTSGPSPFTERSGWELFRAYLGMASSADNAVTGVLLDMAGVIAVLALGVGWAAAIARHRVRGALVALLVVVGGLEVFAISGQSANLQYRVLQLGLPALILLATVGWDLVLRRARFVGAAHAARPRLRRIRSVAPGRILAGLGAIACAGFVVTNLTTVVLTTSYDRAENQHVPAAFVDKVEALVQRVGADEVSVVTPGLTDLATMSLVLSRHPEVDYPAVVSANAYVGSVPHWDRQPDPYYVVGPGATVSGDVTYLERDGSYAIVELHDSGMIVTPFQGPWWRPTFMRGFPCAQQGVRLLVIRGSTDPRTLQVATTAPDPRSNSGLVLQDERGRTLRSAVGTRRSGDWTIQRLKVPQTRSAILTIDLTASLAAQQTVGVPVQFVAGAPSLAAVDPDLVTACLTDLDSGMDGYDRELTLMRAAP